MGYSPVLTATNGLRISLQGMPGKMPDLHFQKNLSSNYWIRACLAYLCFVRHVSGAHPGSVRNLGLTPVIGNPRNHGK